MIFALYCHEVDYNWTCDVHATAGKIRVCMLLQAVAVAKQKEVGSCYPITYVRFIHSGAQIPWRHLLVFMWIQISESRFQRSSKRKKIAKSRHVLSHSMRIPCVHPFAYVLSLKISFRIVSWYRVISYRTSYFVIHACSCSLPITRFWPASQISLFTLVSDSCFAEGRFSRPLLYSKSHS